MDFLSRYFLSIVQGSVVAVIVDILEALQLLLQSRVGILHEVLNHTGFTAPEVLLEPVVNGGDHQVAAIDVYPLAALSRRLSVFSAVKAFLWSLGHPMQAQLIA